MRPRLIAAGVAVVVVAGALLIALPQGDPNDTNGAERDLNARDPGGDPEAQIRLPPGRRWFGFSGAFFAWTGRNPDLDQGLTAERTVADALAGGANSARLPVSWWDLEPKPGLIDQQYVARLDAFIRPFERHGGRVLLLLGTPPPWASGRRGPPGAAPRGDAATVAAFARYAAFVARRWPRALAIETWNEPNGIFAWRPAPQPERYARLHVAAAAAIRKAVPQMTVVVGGLAALTRDARFMPPGRYLERMYRAGLRPRDYDGLAVHPYPEQGSVRELDEGIFAEGLEDFRQGFAARDPDATLWITETGATTSGPRPLSPEDQAAQIVRLLRTLLTMPRVAGVYLHTQYDQESTPPRLPEHGYGVLESRGADAAKPKPAFCALNALAVEAPPFPACRASSR